MRSILYLAILVFGYSLSYGQGYTGYYKHKSEVQGLGLVLRIHLDNDQSFRYVYAFDLFYDDTMGTYSVSNDTIYLSFNQNELTKSPYTLDSTKYLFNTDPPITYYKKNTVNMNLKLDYLYDARPSKLLIKKNRLIIIEPRITTNRKAILKRVPEDEWDNSGATYIQLVK